MLIQEKILDQCLQLFYRKENLKKSLNVLVHQQQKTMYIKLVRKLCNTRIEEFLSTQHQKLVSKKGYASQSGQNLRLPFNTAYKFTFTFKSCIKVI